MNIVRGRRRRIGFRTRGRGKIGERGRGLGRKLTVPKCGRGVEEKIKKKKKALSI
jgi:hypothetical protein